MTQENGQPHEPELVCMLCGSTTTVQAAVYRGWVPVAYGKNGRGICYRCTATHLELNEEHGDFELDSGHPLPNASFDRGREA